jgi:anti-sigma regulatory factor (Ser/Thr protein kinase)
MTRSRTFPPRPDSVGAARRFASETLADLPAHAFEPIELMVSELATNSVRHSHTEFRLTIGRTSAEIRVEVRDCGGGDPAKRCPGPEEPSGRGLQIVELLSDAWGVDRAEGPGKTVWLTVASPPAAAARI